MKLKLPVDFFHQEFRGQRAGLPDLLRWTTIHAPGLVLGKGGELIATFSYRGPDLQCVGEHELGRYRLSISNIMKSLVSGWMLHASSMRDESVTYPSEGAFPDAVTRAIEAERAEQYQREGTHYENTYFLTFTYLPEKRYLSRIREFAFDSSAEERLSNSAIARKTIANFEAKVTEYASTLQSLFGNEVRRLLPYRTWDQALRKHVWFDAQAAFLHTCLTGKQQPIRLPEKVLPFGLNHLIGAYQFSPGMRPILDDQLIRVIAIESPPDEGTYFGILDKLNRIGVKYRWTTRWIALDPEKVKADTRRLRGKWKQQIYGVVADLANRRGGPKNEDAEKMGNDAETVLSDLSSGDVAYGQWTSTIILMDNNSQFMDETVSFLLLAIRDLGFTCRDETINATEAFLGSLPGHGYENLRRPVIHSINLADLFPASATWQGPVSNPCAFYKSFYPDGVVPPLLHGTATGGTPFRLVLHNDDNGHTFVIGPPGSGKSACLSQMVASHFRYPSAQVFGIDKGESMLALCLGAGGRHYNFLDDESHLAHTIGFAPFANVDVLGERVWASDYLTSILVLHDVVVTPDVTLELRRVLELLASRPKHMRSFTELNLLISLREVKQVLALYEGKGGYAGGMLDAKTDTVAPSQFSVFEMEKLMAMSTKHVVPVLLYLFRIIERALNGAPTMVFLDEAWLMLQHPMFAEKIKEWLKVLRKANALVIFATQELADIANSPIASTVFSTCQTRILLANPAAQIDGNAKLYQAIGLSDREIEMLVYARPKADYFFMSQAGKRMFQLELGPVSLAFVGVSGIEDRKEIKRLHALYGDQWVTPWLKSRDIDPNVLKR